MEEVEKELDDILSSAKNGILSGKTISIDMSKGVDISALFVKYGIHTVVGCNFSCYGQVNKMKTMGKMKDMGYPIFETIGDVTIEDSAYEILAKKNKDSKLTLDWVIHDPGVKKMSHSWHYKIYGLETLQEAVEKINSKFEKNFHYLYVFILNKTPRRPTRLGSVINSASRAEFDVEDKDTIVATLKFGSTDFKAGEKGWGSIQKKPDYLATKIHVKDHNTEMGLILPRVNKISIYEWGFQIETSGPTDMVCIKSAYANCDRQYHLNNLGKKWELPFKEDNCATENFMKPFLTWMLVEDDLSDLFGDKEPKLRLRDYGQRDLDIDLE